MIKRKISIADGRIINSELSDIVEIISDGKREVFPNCIVLPGLSDSHCHVWGLGMLNSGMDISGSETMIGTLKIAERNAFKKGDWLIGRGWNNELWIDKSMPDKYSADNIFPDIPMALTRVDGHAVWCNSKALELAGISVDSINPVGGKILKDTNNEPNGILIDNAMNLINSKIPEFSDEQLENFILKGLDICLKSGLTAVHDMDVSPRMVRIYMRLNERNMLPIRVFAFVSCQNNEVIDADIKPFKSEMFSVTGIKLFADGALGSFGAALLNPYNDSPLESGLLILNKEDMLSTVNKSLESGLDAAVHAIGDRAVREVLDVFEKVRKSKPHLKNSLRIEHSQTVHPSDLLRYKQSDVIASVQAIHFTGDAMMADKRLGRQRMTDSAYRWKSFLNAGVKLIGGSDFPIESHNPFKGIESFVERTSKLDYAAELESEKISLDEALTAYTVSPYESLGINDIGLIKKDFKADLIVVNPADRMGDYSIEAVYVNGQRAV